MTNELTELSIDKQGGLLLAPYRVLDLTDEKGLLCGKVLADLGADVVIIEQPGGSPARRLGPFYHATPHPERSFFWAAYNTNKRGITLNIEARDGRALFRRLVERADLILESFPPGYMDRLELGYSKLSELNPGVIMVSISAFGQTGPFREYRAPDIVAMAMGGFMSLCGDPDRAPLRLSVEQSYPLAGAQAAIGALVALYYRQITGKGQHVDVSIQESVLFGAQVPTIFWDSAKVVIGRQGQRSVFGTRSKFIWRCKNGYITWQILTAAVASSTRAVVDWMDSKGMAGELREVPWEKIDIYGIRQEQMERWEKLFSEFFRLYTKEELHEEGLKRGSILFPLNTVDDLLRSPQLRARGFWVQVVHPELGESVIYPGAPFKSSETSWCVGRRAPLIGECNEEIYMGELGLSKEDLVIFREANVI